MKLSEMSGGNVVSFAHKRQEKQDRNLNKTVETVNSVLDGLDQDIAAAIDKLTQLGIPADEAHRHVASHIENYIEWEY